MSRDGRARSPTTAAGRSSPTLSSRSLRRQVEDEPKKHDKNYRRYASGIERALALFDATRLEWPDYISFLGRLLKAIQSPPTFSNLPHKSAIAARLAQSLNPSLPSGVHQKALEVYEHIFALIGKDVLGQDLRIYLPGLSPVLSFASLSVRPSFLSIIEDHILSLNSSALRPAVRALILCLLPGLEEESSEDFDRTLKLLDVLKGRTSDDNGELRDDYFWQCMFLATISSPQKRQGALSFLIKRLPKLTPQDPINGSSNTLSVDAEPTVTPEPGLLIRCFACGLEDDQILIQRGFLDLLLGHLPLNSPVLTNMAEETDRARLVTAATCVVLRRDMSLNRRLWSWFMGPTSIEEDNEVRSFASPSVRLADEQTDKPLEVVYVEEYGIETLVLSVLSLLKAPLSTLAMRAKPYRLCLSLMDRVEIGNLLVPRVFLPSMSRLLSYKGQSMEQDYQEVFRSASSFFDGIESGIIWTQLVKLISSALIAVAPNKVHEEGDLELALFIVSNFNIREEEMLAFHIPLTCVLIMAVLFLDGDQNNIAQGDVMTAHNIVGSLVMTLPDYISTNGTIGENDDLLSLQLGNSSSLKQIVMNIQKFYSDHRGDLSVSSPPFSSSQIKAILLTLAGLLLSKTLATTRHPIMIQTQCSIVTSLCSKLPSIEMIGQTPLLEMMRRALKEFQETQSLTLIQSLTQVLAEILACEPSFVGNNAQEISQIATQLVEHLYQYLSPRMPSFHVEASRCLWQIDSMFPEEQVLESCLSRALAKRPSTKAENTDPCEDARRFAVLWMHTMQTFGQSGKRGSIWSVRTSIAVQSRFTFDSNVRQTSLYRPLLLLLDGLRDGTSELRHVLIAWISSLPNVRVILELLLHKICSSLKVNRKSFVRKSSEANLKMTHDNNDRLCEYYFSQMSNILQIGSKNIWLSLLEEPDNEPAEGIDAVAEDKIDALIARACLQIIRNHTKECDQEQSTGKEDLLISAITILQQLIQGSDSANVRTLTMDEVLIEAIKDNISSSRSNSYAQILLIDALLSALKAKYPPLPEAQHDPSGRLPSNDGLNGSIQRQIQHTPPDNRQIGQITKQLVQILQDGISKTTAQSVLGRWVRLLHEILPLFAESLFQSLIPLVETFCTRIEKHFYDLRKGLEEGAQIENSAPDTALDSLLGGLEELLIVAHQRLAFEETVSTPVKAPDHPSGFFGNVVSGVFTSDTGKGRNVTANSRLTIILCFQDVVRTCFSIWAWGSQVQESKRLDSVTSASVAYSSARLRNRARRLMDRLFSIEILESLEPLITMWARQHANPDPPVVNLVHVLDASRPRLLMPALFNAIYSRTNPSALDPARISSLTADLSAIELGNFLVAYTRSLDADAMEEIWTDCVIFLKDVLGNPLLHSQVLPSLLEFMVILAEKVENTNFGEQRRMRRELSDTFMRLLSAIFTTRATNMPQELTFKETEETHKSKKEEYKQKASDRNPRSHDLLTVLNSIVPRFPTILPENDRLASASSSVCANVISPVIHGKSFPINISEGILDLLWKLQKVAPSSKSWRKDVSDLFNHQKLFSCPSALVRDHLLPIIRQWNMADKDLLPELLSRFTAPTSAGIMFGVGANAARQEADRKTQLNLRRVALLLLALESDAVVTSLISAEEKISELLSCTPASSPSSITRAELFMLVRTLVIQTSTTHLMSLWPVISTELQSAISSALPGSGNYDTYNAVSLFEACKLLDLLIVLSPDDFQMHEWLFITDTIDAVYRPGTWEPVGLVDELAEEFATSESFQPPTPQGLSLDLGASDAENEKRKTLLDIRGDVPSMSKEDLVANHLSPWFKQLSIHAFESTYKMGSVSMEEVRQDLLKDLFNDSTIMG